ncbi:MAG: hypothetical protein KW804_00420 [Candidatus Doudnabacteria bacterium]|nr:hypothetical protein [Candidatus Doudnabacteria bacterium]
MKEKSGLVKYVLVVVALAVVATVFIGRGSPISEPVRAARKANATMLIKAVRAAYLDPYEREKRFGLTKTRKGYIRLAIEGPAYVDVHPSKDAIIVNNNGLMDIYDDNGDGKYDSCFDCSVGWEPEQIQKDLQSGISVALQVMGKQPQQIPR